MRIEQNTFIEADTHCHTVASTHAYSTVLEMAQYAALAGLKAIAITDHGPALPDGCHPWHFGNLRSLPQYINGVRVLHGVEANIVDFEGNIDIAVQYQRELDWVTASFHDAVIAPSSIEQHTQAYLKLAENPHIDVIGHSGSENFKYDYERVIPVFKANNKLVEINSHSFGVRAGAEENCRQIALLCKKHEVPVVVNSDAHSCFSVGDVKAALALLQDIGFPQELVVNQKLERLAQWIFKKRNRSII